MTRFLDSLAATLAGILIGALMVAAIAPDAWLVVPTPRPARVMPSLPGHLGRSGQPDSHPRAHRTDRHSARITQPRRTMGGERAPSTGESRSRNALRGLATWYSSPSGAAAGPALRDALGSGWRGRLVRVAAAGRRVVVRLTDWCACGDRGGVPTLIDLPEGAFLALGVPLSRGVLAVTVTVVPAPPQTTTGGVQ